MAVVLLLLEQSGHWSLHVSNKELEQTESSSSTHFVRAHTPRCYAQKPSSTAQPAAGAPSFASPVPERMPYSTGVGRETLPEAEMASRNNLFEQYLAQQQLQQQVQQQIQQPQGAYLQQCHQQSENAALQLYFQQHMEYQARKDIRLKEQQVLKIVALHKCKTLKKKKLNIVALHSECTKFRALTQVRARNDNWAAPSIGTLPVDEVQM